MRLPLPLATIYLLLLCPMIESQGKTSFLATSVCGNATVHQTVQVDDDRRHSISLDQRPCKWKLPIEIGGLTGNEYVSYGLDDIQNEHSVDRGYAVGVMKNGDRYFLSYLGKATMRGNVPEHLEGEWTFTGGSGQLKSLRGSGSYTARPTPEGTMEFVIQGNYELP